MTQQEFTQRAKVEVTAEEFEAINLVYMNSDLDKDEFCTMWRKMNRSRVQKALAERKAQFEEEQKRNRLWRIAERLILMSRSNGQDWYMTAMVGHYLNDSDSLFLTEQGISYTFNKWGGYITPSSLVYDIKVKLNLV